MHLLLFDSEGIVWIPVDLHQKPFTTAIGTGWNPGSTYSIQEAFKVSACPHSHPSFTPSSRFSPLRRLLS